MGITQTTIKGRKMRKGTRRVTAAIFALGLVAAACGGDDSSSEETSAPTETEAPSTDETSAPTETEAPAGGDDVAPSAAVPTGIKVAWLACELPSCTEVGEDWPAIAEALGWELKVINVSSATPGAGVQEAIDWGANYVILGRKTS